MANGGPEHLPDPTWWHALGAMLMGALVSLGIVKRKTGDDAASLEDIQKLAAVTHGQTRAEFHSSLLEALREEREATFELVRSEGRENRKAIYALGEGIGRRLEAIDKDVTRLLDRTPAWNGKQ